ncbi:MAG: hypothetical protein LBD47_09600 [Treponema sp.]|jgi:hypothetical protein|nr:hypothetical protein [Treponema sp.]
MVRSKILAFLLFVPALFFSCASAPQGGAVPPEASSASPPAPASAPVVEASPVIQEPVFDPVTVSEEVFNSTKIDVQRFIEDLNQIIRGRNYDAWRAAISDEYFDKISSPEFLAAISEQPAMKTRNIVLKNPQDYFNNVVVPSRANDRVDDIEFVGQHRVKAYTVTPNGSRLRLYDLETTENTWIIIN